MARNAPAKSPVADLQRGPLNNVEVEGEMIS